MVPLYTSIPDTIYEKIADMVCYARIIVIILQIFEWQSIVYIIKSQRKKKIEELTYGY